MRPRFKHYMAALGLWAGLILPVGASAQERAPDVADLLSKLARAEGSEALRIDREVRASWQRSGSQTLDLLLQRGCDALALRDTEAALDHLGALTDHAPDFADGWQVYSQALFAAGYTGPALDALQRALAINPQHYVAIFGLGQVMAELNRPNAARDAFQRALDLYPDYPEAQAALSALAATDRAL